MQARLPPAGIDHPTSETQRVFGRYRLERKRGEGGMAEVWEAFDPHAGRHVAIKLLKPIFEHDQDHRARFRREVRAAGALLHPNIVTMFDVLEEAGISAIVMELVDGLSLAELIEQSGPVDQGRARRLLLQLAEALGFVHSRGWIHRDLKPSNILLSRDLATAKITDFGIAKIADLEASGVADATLLTCSGYRIGTPRYMAPEQIEGTQVDARTDLFALGAIAYEMLTGARAFDGPSFTAVSYQICNLEPPLLKERIPDLAEDLASTVTRLLHKRPEARFPSAQAFAAALGSATAPERRGASTRQESEERRQRRFRSAQARPVAVGDHPSSEEHQEPLLSRWWSSFHGMLRAKYAKRKELPQKLLKDIKADSGCGTPAGRKVAMVGRLGRSWPIVGGGIALIVVSAGLAANHLISSSSPGSTQAESRDPSQAREASRAEQGSEANNGLDHQPASEITEAKQETGVDELSADDRAQVGQKPGSEPKVDVIQAPKPAEPPTAKSTGTDVGASSAGVEAQMAQQVRGPERREATGAASKRSGTNQVDPARQPQVNRSALVAIINRQVTPCWNIPVGAQNNGDLRAELHLKLARDGGVQSVEPADGARMSVDSIYRTFVESAVRAIRVCSPFRLPLELNSAPPDITLVFSNAGNDVSATRIDQSPGVLFLRHPGETGHALTNKMSYEDALILIQSGRWSEAKQALQSFVEENPNDSRRANASYWLGEAYYVSREYQKAASTFAWNYKTYGTEAEKAPENLLKFGMSLAALGQKDQACLTFAELAKRHPLAPVPVKQVLARERAAAGCGT